MVIYRIKNKLNGKSYIGQTTCSVNERWKQHCNNHESISAIASAIKKYGTENFEIEELAKAESREQLNDLERFYIQFNDSLAPNGYNLKDGGNAQFYTQIAKDKMSAAKIGKTASVETREKMSKTHKMRWVNNDLRIRRSQQSKEIWQQDEYRENIIATRKEYWTSEENRQRASEKGKKILDRKKISNAVKKAYQRADVRANFKASVERSKKKVIGSNGVVYPSLKEAALANNTKSSSIIRCIRGKYKQAGGLTWKFVDDNDNKPRNRPVVYLACGVSGSGKSWVCNQLTDKFHYVSFDDIRKNDHLPLIRQLCKLKDKPVLYDPTIKISTFIKRNTMEFDIRPVFIKEPKEIIEARLTSRGGAITDSIINRMHTIDKRIASYGVFSGTSQEVLDYLKTVTCKD